MTSFADWVDYNCRDLWSLLDGTEVHAAGVDKVCRGQIGSGQGTLHVCLQVGPVSIVVQKVLTKVSLYYSVQ